MRQKQRDYIGKIEPLLRKHQMGGSGSVLLYLPLRDLKSILAYLTDVPRITPIGVTMTEERAARIVGGTLRGRGNIRLAMQVDCLDNQYTKIANSLRKTGVDVNSSELKEAEGEDALRYTALLHAEDRMFTDFNYHKDAKTPKVEALYQYVGENPTQAAQIMEIAKQRYSLDIELIKAVLGTEAPALGTGVL